MNFEKRTSIVSVAAVVLIILFVFFVLKPLLAQIQEEADNFILQKNRLAELAVKEENLRLFQENRKEYQPSLVKIDDLFINAAEPVGFIGFLEKEAINSRLTIEITPFSPQKLETDLWLSMNFRLALGGDFPDLFGFLEKLENGPYLLEVSSLNIRRVAAKEGLSPQIEASLLLKVYSK